MSRAERIEELIRSDISEILRARVSDPRIGFVSITDVDLSPDLKNAKIYFSTIAASEKEKENCIKGLQSATRFIRGELGKKLELRAMPTIEFIYDNSLERGSKVLTLINKVEEKDGRDAK